MHVICTAGHVDHGKSTLVRALTGIEPDRFAEERRRGLTIDIGFAWTTVEHGGSGDNTIAFVDLPGHERFIANMLAGAGAARLALFVVAADEGWMPQSAEHLAILDLLGITGGVVAVTRTDLVDDETEELAVELVREELAGTVLQDAPIVGVSAVNGVGLDTLRTALADLVVRAGAGVVGDRPRLWVDRSFSVAGAGTIVTGTLTGGKLRVDDEVTLTPSGTVTRIRGLQQLQEPVTVAHPGRVAINLAGLAKDAITRGDAVVRGPWARTGTVDAHVRSVGQRGLRRRGAWHLHVGSAERVVQIEPWSGEVGPDGGLARLSFDPPLPLQPGDALVLRETGARETVGGGRVVDVRPPARRRGRAARERRLTELHRRSKAVQVEDAGEFVAAVMAERLAAEGADLDAEVGVVGAGELVPDLVRMGSAWADPGAVSRWRETVTATLAAYHAEHPLSPGAPRALVRATLLGVGCPEDHVAGVERLFVDDGTIQMAGPAFHLPDHRITFDAQQQDARRRVLDVLDADGATPPDLDVLIDRARASQELVRALEATGDVVRLNERLVFSRSAYAAAIESLRDLYASSGAFTTAEAREQLATTRKYIIPLLEELDRRGVTRRVGDRREVR